MNMISLHLKHLSKALVTLLSLNVYLTCIIHALNDGIQPRIRGQGASKIAQIQVLDEHNKVRLSFGVQNQLTYSYRLEEQALNTAKINANNCEMKHSGNDNLYMLPGFNENWNLQNAIVDGIRFWAEESTYLKWYYNRYNPLHSTQPYSAEYHKINTLRYIRNFPIDPYHEYGHLQAMVWKDAKEVGCAYAIKDACINTRIVNGVTTTYVGPQFHLVCVYNPNVNVEGRTFDGQPWDPRMFGQSNPSNTQISNVRPAIPKVNQVHQPSPPLVNQYTVKQQPQITRIQNQYSKPQQTHIPMQTVAKLPPPPPTRPAIQFMRQTQAPKLFTQYPPSPSVPTKTQPPKPKPAPGPEPPFVLEDEQYGQLKLQESGSSRNHYQRLLLDYVPQKIKSNLKRVYTTIVTSIFKFNFKKKSEKREYDHDRVKGDL